MEMKAYSEKRTKITIKKISYEYYGSTEEDVYSKAEKLGKLSSEYRELRKKPKVPDFDYSTSLKNRKLSKEKIMEINDFNLSYVEIHRYLSTTGIDLKYYSVSSSFNIILEDLKHLVSSGKYVNLILFDEDRELNTNPLTIDNIDIKKFAIRFPKFVKIMRIKRSDFEEL